MSKLALIIFTLLLPGAAKSQGVEFPSSPDGQVFDPTGWLGADRIVRLRRAKSDRLSPFLSSLHLNVFSGPVHHSAGFAGVGQM